MKKVIVAGARDFRDRSFVATQIDLAYPEEFVLVSGCASGVDTCGEAYADARKYNKVLFPANWKRYAKSAGTIRNRAMAEYADELLAFLKAGSRGTADMIKVMTSKGKKVTIINI